MPDLWSLCRECCGFLPVRFWRPNWPKQTFSAANGHDKMRPITDVIGVTQLNQKPTLPLHYSELALVSGWYFFGADTLIRLLRVSTRISQVRSSENSMPSRP